MSNETLTLLLQQNWLFVIGLGCIFILVILRLQAERHIRAIGGKRAPKIHTLPFGMIHSSNIYVLVVSDS